MKKIAPILYIYAVQNMNFECYLYPFNGNFLTVFEIEATNRSHQLPTHRRVAHMKIVR